MRPTGAYRREEPVGGKIRRGVARCKYGAPLLAPKNPRVAHQVNRPGQFVAIDHDLDLVAFAHFADGAPASASGEMWPMHAPVETPLKRASVSSATCLHAAAA